jgi:hypothetical protein
MAKGMAFWDFFVAAMEICTEMIERNANDPLMYWDC